MDKSTPSEPKIIISGTGRCGTTFLVRIFTYLGFDTGFSIEQIEGADHNGGPGLEHHTSLYGQPQVIKSPSWAFSLNKIRLDWEKSPIKCIIVAVRDPAEVALSRFRRGEIAIQLGGAPWAEHRHGGPINSPHDLSKEIRIAKLMLGNFWEAFNDNGFKIPMEFIEFKKFTKDPEYLYDKLQPLFEEKGILLEDFKEGYSKATKLWKKGEF